MKRPPTPEHLKWLRANGHNLAPLTGTDTKALAAVAACWELYAYTRSDRVLKAAHELAAEMQDSTRPLARELIAFAMEWDDRERLWPEAEGV